MNRPGYEILPGPGFSRDQHRGIHGGGQLHQPHRLGESFPAADENRLFALPFGFIVLDLFGLLQAEGPEGFVHGQPQYFQFKGLGKIVKGSRPNGFHRAFKAGVGYTVRRALKEESLIIPIQKKHSRNVTRPRFFERATPNQMWQRDIFTFRLGGRYAYLVRMIDDYSRYLVGLELYRSQTADQVMEVYRRAVGEYGVPKEMLTDQGRQ